MPLESVVSVSVFVPVVANAQPGAEGAVKITDTPTDGFPFTVTSATSGAEKAVPTVVLWPDPLDTTRTGGGVVCVLLQSVRIANSMQVSSAATIRGSFVKQLLMDSLLKSVVLGYRLTVTARGYNRTGSETL
jgi:hypothetical protein